MIGFVRRVCPRRTGPGLTGARVHEAGCGPRQPSELSQEHRQAMAPRDTSDDGTPRGRSSGGLSRRSFIRATSAVALGAGAGVSAFEGTAEGKERHLAEPFLFMERTSPGSRRRRRTRCASQRLTWRRAPRREFGNCWSCGRAGGGAGGREASRSGSIPGPRYRWTPGRRRGSARQTSASRSGWGRRCSSFTARTGLGWHGTGRRRCSSCRVLAGPA